MFCKNIENEFAIFKVLLVVVLFSYSRPPELYSYFMASLDAKYDATKEFGFRISECSHVGL